MDDEASTVCETEFAGDRDVHADEMRARLEGLEPRNVSHMVVNDDAPNLAVEPDPSHVRALATRFLTEGDGRLAQLMGEPIVTDATLQLIKFAKKKLFMSFSSSLEMLCCAAVAGR